MQKIFAGEIMVYDVVVIGAGVTGASVAWQLSHYDLQVILICCP